MLRATYGYSLDIATSYSYVDMYIYTEAQSLTTYIAIYVHIATYVRSQV